MSRWDTVLLGLFGFMAVMTMVRMMLARRSQLYDEIDRQLTAAREAAKTNTADQNKAA